MFGKKEEKSKYDERYEDHDTEEEEPEDDSPTVYEFCYECDNCGEEQCFDIPMGTRAKDFLKGKKCENCGCNVLEEEAE